MKFSKLLPLPESHPLNQRKARSEIGVTEGQGEVDPTVPHPTESTPNARVGTSTLPMPSHPTPRDQKTGGM